MPRFYFGRNKTIKLNLSLENGQLSLNEAVFALLFCSRRGIILPVFSKSMDKEQILNALNDMSSEGLEEIADYISTLLEAREADKEQYRSV